MLICLAGSLETARAWAAAAEAADSAAYLADHRAPA